MHKVTAADNAVVCLSVMQLHCAKMAEQIKVHFRVDTLWGLEFCPLYS